MLYSLYKLYRIGIHCALALIACARPCVGLQSSVPRVSKLAIDVEGTVPETYTHADLAQLIRRHGYDVEQHFAETKDGYVLGLYRILPNKPAETSAYPVVLQHGLLDTAATWVVNDARQSLGLILVDHGYDVWLANSRGSTFSRNHTGFAPESANFWDFTMDEMATFDIPTTIDYVRRRTGSEDVALVAHSQGGAISLAALSEDTIPTGHVSVLITLAPAVYLKYISSVPLQFLAKIHADTLFEVAGRKEFLPTNQDMSDLFGEFCSVQPQQCASILTAICGFNPKNIDESRLPIYLAYAPGGTSVKNIAHWAQRVRDAESKAAFSFRKYDYGTVCDVGNVRRPCNQRIYGHLAPPSYDLSRIRARSDVKIGVIYGLEDKLADPIDVKRVIDQLGDRVVFKKALLGFEHIDFTWSVNAARDVYTDVLHLLPASSRRPL